MVLVLFFDILLLMIIIFFHLTIFSTLEISVEKFQKSNLNKKNSLNKDNINYIIISLVLLKKFKWIKVKIDNKKIKKIASKVDFSKFNMKNIERKITITNIKELINIKPQILLLDLKLELGFENILFTTYMIPLLSSLLSIFLPYVVNKKDIDKVKYKVNPIYNEQLTYDIYLNVIFRIKILKILKALHGIFRNDKVK